MPQGNPAGYLPNANKVAKARASRTLGSEAQGSTGDARDRFRDVYKPGANKPAEFGNPFKQIPDAVRRLKKFFKGKKKTTEKGAA